MNWCRKKINSGELSRGIFIVSDSTTQVEIPARSGFDWLILDMEHGLSDEAAVKQQIAVIQRFTPAPIIRIPALKTHIIKRVLDYGAAGIMCPMVANADEARKLVSAMRYPPAGVRGLSGGSMAAGFGLDFQDYFAMANTGILSVAQIETRAGLEAAEEIAAVDGIDVLFIGHSDLSLNLGCHNDFTNPEILNAEKIVVEACRKHGKTAGMLLKSSMDIREYTNRGFKFMAQGTDLGLLRNALAKLPVL